MNIKQVLQGLKDFTAECNSEMHDTGNQSDFRALLVGTHLDNAMGGDYTRSCGEYHLLLTKADGKTLDINLADLIALARRA